MFPQQGPVERDAPFPEPIVYSFIHLSEVPVYELSYEMFGKHKVTVHRAPRGRKDYIKWGATWFPKGIIYVTAITTPMPCSLQLDTFHLILGRLQPR